MVKSMTGFGKAIASSKNLDVSIEIKSVNSKNLDFNSKIPRVLNKHDDELIRLVKKKCVRGKVSLYYSLDYHNTEFSKYLLNIEKVRNYIKIAKEIQLELNAESSITVNQLMKFDDIYDDNNNDRLTDELKKTFFDAVSKALDDLEHNKLKEGKNLKKDLETRLKNVETYLSQISSISTESKTEDFKKYKKRITSLIEDVLIDDQRILQEVAIIAEKRDFSEEIVRLGSHIDLFNSYFGGSENNGRKMNFLLQEMLRETNTIGSKTDLIKVSHIVVEIKDEIEKIREQVQNIL